MENGKEQNRYVSDPRLIWYLIFLKPDASKQQIVQTSKFYHFLKRKPCMVIVEAAMAVASTLAKKQPNGCAKPVSALLLSFNSNALIINIQNKANELFGPHEQKVTQCESFYEQTTTMFTTFQSGKFAILCTPLIE